MAKKKTEPQFTPYPGYLVLALPEEVYPTILIHNEKQWKDLIEKKSQEMVNGEIEVAKVGEGITFVKPGDRICLASHARVQNIESGDIKVEHKGDFEPKKIWWVIRESDILVKFDK
jgi:hypothetical protein